MKNLIAIAFFAITAVASSAQTTNKYQEVSLERFQELQDSLSADSLLEFEVRSYEYINTPSSTVDTAISDLKEHNVPTTEATISTGRTQYSASNDIVNLLDTTYVCVIQSYSFGEQSVVVYVISSRLNVTWADTSFEY
jgi:hypothetical protein